MIDEVDVGRQMTEDWGLCWAHRRRIVAGCLTMSSSSGNTRRQVAQFQGSFRQGAMVGKRLGPDAFLDGLPLLRRLRPIGQAWRSCTGGRRRARQRPWWGPNTGGLIRSGHDPVVPDQGIWRGWSQRVRNACRRGGGVTLEGQDALAQRVRRRPEEGGPGRGCGRGKRDWRGKWKEGIEGRGPITIEIFR